jgi:hypothetical protein
LTGSVAIAGLGWLRAAGPHKTELSAAMLAVTAGLAAITFHHGRKTSSALRELTISRLASNLRARGGLVLGVRAFFAGH